MNNQTPIPVQKLLTHQAPDLDAALSVYMIRKYGEPYFPGCSEAPLEFASANEFQNNLNAEELEESGTLALDIGGGRFDTHPVPGKQNEDKADSCASELVAEYLGLSTNPEYRYLLEFVRIQDSQGISLKSKDASHHVLSPPGLLDGLHRLLKNDTKVINAFFPGIEGLLKAAETDETPLNITAQRFDRALNRYLTEQYEEGISPERAEPLPWASEGAALKTARERGWEKHRAIEKLLLTSTRLLAGLPEALPEEEKERRILLPAMLNGLADLYGEESDEYYAKVLPFFASVVKREVDWFDALSIVKRSARVFRSRKGTFVAIASKNGLVIKAVRYRLKANVVLYFDPESHAVTVQSGTGKGNRPPVDVPRLAGLIRTAERKKQDGNYPVKMRPPWVR